MRFFLEDIRDLEGFLANLPKRFSSTWEEEMQYALRERDQKLGMPEEVEMSAWNLEKEPYICLESNQFGPSCLPDEQNET